MKRSKPSYEELERQLEFNSHTLYETQVLSQIGSWNWDLISNEVDWSEMMYHLLGISSSENTPSYELAFKHVHEDDKERYQSALGEAVSNCAPYYLENRIRKADKSVISVVSRGMCIFDDEGKLVRMLGTVQDITSKKAISDLLAQSQIKNNQTNELKNSFLSNITAEIRTPLNHILGFSELLKDQHLSNDEKSSYIKYITSGSQTLMAIISDITDLSALETNQYGIRKENCNLTELFEDLDNTFSQLNKDKKNSLVLNNHVLDGHTQVKIDEKAVKQIMSKLLDNAYKFTENGRIEFGYKIINENIQFYVTDTGIGIREENQGFVFDKFSKINVDQNVNSPGNGIGLTISKGLVELLKGKIWFESKENEGSTFYFTIPYVQSEF